MAVADGFRVTDAEVVEIAGLASITAALRSRTISAAGLSLRSARKTAWRKRPPLVHAAKDTSATSVGSTHRTLRSVPLGAVMAGLVAASLASCRPI